METFDRLNNPETRLLSLQWRFWCFAALALAILMLILFSIFSPNRPVSYSDDLEHFYYGSIGSDISGGLPVKVLRVLPEMFPEYLPEGAVADYTAFGFIQQPGHAMPIGFSTRRQLIDLTSINCGTCHTGSVRESPSDDPLIIAGMPANTVDLLSFFKFLFQCAGDERFNTAKIYAKMKEKGLTSIGDRLIYANVVPLMKNGLLERKAKLDFVLQDDYPKFGPGRVNTFDTFKYDQFAYYYHKHGQTIDPDEIFGIVDFTSVWNQGAREGLSLHWDGNNDSVFERNFSAAIGAGATPRDMDIPRLTRIKEWLDELPPPTYPFDINDAAAMRGKPIYEQLCASCHSFEGAEVGQVVDISEIQTDRSRLDSYTQFLKEAQQDYTGGHWWSFTHFKKTNGYANQPLDGIWARAPYLHNGSVPNMWTLLTPEDRPVAFTLGNDVYDQQDMGFKHRHLQLFPQDDSKFANREGDEYLGTEFVLDTRLKGNGNQGHVGKEYGTELSPEEKRDLIEFLKWQDKPREQKK